MGDSWRKFAGRVDVGGNVPQGLRLLSNLSYTKTGRGAKRAPASRMEA